MVECRESPAPAQYRESLVPVNRESLAPAQYRKCLGPVPRAFELVQANGVSSGLA